MLPKPCCDGILFQLACRQRQHHPDRIDCLKLNLMSVDRKKKAGEHPRRPLVAVDKGVVARDAEGISSGQSRRIVRLSRMAGPSS